MPDFARRDIILAGILGAAAAPLPLLAATDMAPSLDILARRKGLRFGSAISWGTPGADRGSIANPPYERLVAAECGLIVAENEMKWQALRPSPTTFAFERFDAILAWAERQRLGTRGHNLLWHQPKWFPKWLNSYDFGATPKREGERVLTTHIETVLTRYGKRIGSYDVVNEAVRPADGQLYDTSLSTAIGGAEATLDLAVHTARAAAP